MAGGEDSGGGGGGAWGVHYDPTPGDARPAEDGKRRLIRGEGLASRVSGTVWSQDPGGGATPVAAPRWIRTNDVSDTAELSRGGGGGSVGPLQNVGGVGRGDQCWGYFTTGVSMRRSREAATGRHERPLGGTVSQGDTRSPYGGGGGWEGGGGGWGGWGVGGGGGWGGGWGVGDGGWWGFAPFRYWWGAPSGGCYGYTSSVCWGTSRLSVVLVDETMAGDTPGRECLREDGNWRPRTGETRPAGVSVGGDNVPHGPTGPPATTGPSEPAGFAAPTE